MVVKCCFKSVCSFEKVSLFVQINNDRYESDRFSRPFYHASRFSAEIHRRGKRHFRRSKGGIDVYLIDSPRSGQITATRPLATFSMEIYSLILIKYFGSLGSHSSLSLSPRINLLEPCVSLYLEYLLSTLFEKYNSNRAVPRIFWKFHRRHPSILERRIQFILSPFIINYNKNRVKYLFIFAQTLRAHKPIPRNLSLSKKKI